MPSSLCDSTALTCMLSMSHRQIASPSVLSSGRCDKARIRIMLVSFLRYKNDEKTICPAMLTLLGQRPSTPLFRKSEKIYFSDGGSMATTILFFFLQLSLFIRYLSMQNKINCFIIAGVSGRLSTAAGLAEEELRRSGSHDNGEWIRNAIWPGRYRACRIL